MKTPNAFLDRIKESKKLKTDLQIAMALKSSPVDICRARKTNKISAKLILNAHLLTNISVLELLALANKAVQS
jgi:hypothetical protein